MDKPAFPNDPEFQSGKPAAVTLQGPAGALEAIVEGPEADADPRPVVMVVCHPLPTEGGTMHNKVVTMTARALRQSGATTVRFNFRGVGASQGAFDNGDGEADDLRAVIAWVREQRPDHQLWLGGFSFGSYVAFQVASEVDAGLLLMIAPPAGRRGYDFDRIAAFDGPWIVIQGETDDVVDPEQVYAWANGFEQPPELVRIPDASHFFHRKLIDLRGAVKHGIRPYLPAAKPAADA
ncbi:alpha/beta fold hydrolase [Lysobacter sp. H21R4]|uniref:alpha/beta hydrolase n=1 Tax=Lysobacter sp. H21R4 TaxID=2781021 RepID=UPI0018896672|nr:alpha/beta fold hydrolase [Lysobacter sp. H21R4]QOY62733.1 alpha/beta fold hydrolase [Lysobacter sp. H21R4]